MNGTAMASPEARRYIEAVRAELGDLPAEDRDELLADAEVSVHEAAAEDPSSVASRLGTPAAFAAELRAAAGYPTASGPPSEPGRSIGVRRLRRALERLAAAPKVRRARELAPLWWVARAYVAVATLALLGGGGFAASQPLLPTPTGPLRSVLLLALAVAGSVWLGLRRTTGRTLTALNAGLALAAVLVAMAVLSNPRADTPVVVTSTVPAESPPMGLVKDGVPVQNLYVYTREGRLLLDALVYDGHGEPVEIASVPGADPLRRPVVDRRGREVFNAFPIRYFEPGTRRIEDPRAAPQVDLPELVTPPATKRRRRP